MGTLRPHTFRSARWLLLAATLGVCAGQSAVPPGMQPPPIQPAGPQATPPQSPQNAQPAAAAPHNDTATVLALTGQVSVMRDSTPYALFQGNTISTKQMVVTGSDGYAVFQVNDGSTIEVFPNSKFTFRNNMDWHDLVDLWIGKIKVHVQKWGGQPNKQKITTPTAVISVRGTTFLVEHDDLDSTLIVVEEGQVAVGHRLLAYNNLREVNAGEQLRVYRDVPLAKAKADKGKIMEHVANGVWEAIRVVLTRGSSPGSGGGSTGGASPSGGGGAPAPLPGDTGATPPPAPPPMPGDTGATPPPPPPPGN